MKGRSARHRHGSQIGEGSFSDDDPELPRRRKDFRSRAGQTANSFPWKFFGVGILGAVVLYVFILQTGGDSTLFQADDGPAIEKSFDDVRIAFPEVELPVKEKNDAAFTIQRKIPSAERAYERQRWMSSLKAPVSMDEFMSHMTIDEKISQILFVRVHTFDRSRDLEDILRKGLVGGVAVAREVQASDANAVKGYVEWMKTVSAGLSEPILNNIASSTRGGHVFDEDVQQDDTAVGEGEGQKREVKPRVFDSCSTDEAWREGRRREAEVFKAAGAIPMFVAGIFEGGDMRPYPDILSEWPNEMAIGAAANDTLAYLSGRLYGKEVASMGFNMAFAPVVDVNTNPSNPVIGPRSYGSFTEGVSRASMATAAGFASAGVIPTLKHFPGHGDTAVDSHSGLPVIEHKKERLIEIDAQPYLRVFNMTSKDPLEGDLTVRMPVSVMTAHLSIPALDPTVIKPRSEQHNIDAKIGGLEGVFRSWGKPQRRGRHAGRAEEEPPRSIVIPATLSKPTLTDYLRDELGFNYPGDTVVTDSIRMGAISRHFSPLDAAFRSITAGADLLLYTNRDWRELRAYHEYLVQSAMDGTLPMERVDEAVRRVLFLKARAGLISRNVLAVPSEVVKEDINDGVPFGKVQDYSLICHPFMSKERLPEAFSMVRYHKKIVEEIARASIVVLEPPEPLHSAVSLNVLEKVAEIVEAYASERPPGANTATNVKGIALIVTPKSMREYGPNECNVFVQPRGERASMLACEIAKHGVSLVEFRIDSGTTSEFERALLAGWMNRADRVVWVSHNFGYQGAVFSTLVDTDLVELLWSIKKGRIYLAGSASTKKKTRAVRDKAFARMTLVSVENPFDLGVLPKPGGGVIVGFDASTESLIALAAALVKPPSEPKGQLPTLIPQDQT